MNQAFTNNDLLGWTKQFSNAALKANQIAIAGFERALDVQVKALERQTKLHSEFFADLTENSRGGDAFQALLPKTAELVKHSTDHVYSVGHALLDNVLKTNEEIGQVVRGQYDVAQAEVQNVVSNYKNAN